MNQDSTVKFIKSEVSRYHDEIRFNAQAKLLAQHRILVNSTGVPWLTDVNPEYNRSEAKLVAEQWKHRQEGESIPDLLPVDEELDLRVKEASEILTRLGEAAGVDYDYVENLLEPLTGPSEFRYWIARSPLHSPELVEESQEPSEMAQAPAVAASVPVAVVTPHTPAARPVVPLAPPGVKVSSPLVKVAALVPPTATPVAAVAAVPIAAVVEAMPVLEPVHAPTTTESIASAFLASSIVVPITTRIATSSRPVVEEVLVVAELE